MSITTDEIQDLFMNQVDCGSVVASQFSDETNRSASDLMKACSGFGGGLFCGETCGAIAAANVVIGLKYGIDTPGDEEGKTELIKKVSEFNARMHEKYPSFLCTNLLGSDLATAAESGKMMQFCPNFCKEVIDTLKEII